MRSLIIIEVEHGETTDDVEAIVNNVSADWLYAYPTVDVLNSSVRIDLPSCFVLDSGHTNNEGN